jgi:hypothetical protein
MIIKLETKVNMEQLKNYLDFVLSKSKPFMKKGGPWGGWSITSSTGDIFDGWQTGEKVYSKYTSEEEKKSIQDFFSKADFSKPTSLYNDFITSLLESINSELPNLKITRLRIAILKPHPEEDAYWHRDSDQAQTFRLHIPIISNDKCFFDYEDKRHHLLADGSIYIIDVGKIHRAVNLSNQDRYHMIADIFNNSSIQNIND